MPKNSKPESHTQYRGEDGEFISKEEAEKLSKDKYTKEQVPNPGHGDTGKGKGNKKK